MKAPTLNTGGKRPVVVLNVEYPNGTKIPLAYLLAADSEQANRLVAAFILWLEGINGDQSAAAMSGAAMLDKAPGMQSILAAAKTVTESGLTVAVTWGNTTEFVIE